MTGTSQGLFIDKYTVVYMYRYSKQTKRNKIKTV